MSLIREIEDGDEAQVVGWGAFPDWMVPVRHSGAGPADWAGTSGLDGRTFRSGSGFATPGTSLSFSGVSSPV